MKIIRLQLSFGKIGAYQGFEHLWSGDLRQMGGVSLLRKADDAIILDNTNFTIAQQLKFAFNWIEKK